MNGEYQKLSVPLFFFYRVGACYKIIKKISKCCTINCKKMIKVYQAKYTNILRTVEHKKQIQVYLSKAEYENR